MKKILCGAIAATLLLANNGSCVQAPANPSDPTPSTRAAQLCQEASRAGAAAETILQALIAAHLAEAKARAVLPLVQKGELVIGAGCALLPGPSATPAA